MSMTTNSRVPDTLPGLPNAGWSVNCAIAPSTLATTNRAAAGSSFAM